MSRKTQNRYDRDADRRYRNEAARDDRGYTDRYGRDSREEYYESRGAYGGRDRYPEDIRYDDQYYRDREYYRDDTPADYFGPPDGGRASRRREDRRAVRRRRHPVRGCLTVLVLLLLLLAGGAYALFRLGLLSALNPQDILRNLPLPGSTGETEAEGTAAEGTAVKQDPAVTNILLIGQDARTGEEQTRTDTMILASINSRTQQITLVSLMRDMYVPIPGYGSDRLNAANVYGGVELLDQTIREDFGIGIDGNAMVDMDGFLTALTSVGNLEIELTQEEADYLNYNMGIGYADEQTDLSGESWYLTAGLNTMTPNQVLAYCRMREVGNSDWDRTERQRKVLLLAFEKLKQSDPLTQLSVAGKILPAVSTDMGSLSLIQSAVTGIFSGSNEVRTFILPAEGTYYADNIDGMAVLVPDLEANASLLQQYLYS